MLALDTCMAACSAAVTRDGEVLASASEVMERGHQERLATLVREVVGDAGIAFAQIDRVVATTGPGSFTGLRVGLAFAKGLGLALNRPVVGVGTLAALAASETTDGVTLVAVDARRGQTWLQAFGDGEALSAAEAPDQGDAPASAATLARGPVARLVGSAAEQLAAAFPAAVVISRDAPDPVALARLGAAVDPREAPATPIYLRAPDAKRAA